MNADELKSKLGSYRFRGQEVVFQECPFCHNARWNFEVNEAKGVYFCWVCQQGGSVQLLMRDLGLKYVRPPAIVNKPERPNPGQDTATLPGGLTTISADNKDVMKYLAYRKITMDDVATYRMMWWPDEKRVLFPFYSRIGNLEFWTARTIYKDVTPKYYHAKVHKKHRVIFYEGPPGAEIFLVEGVFDAIAVHKEGKTALILFGTQVSNDVIDYLRLRDEFVVLCLDKDAITKQDQYERILAAELGRGRVRAFYVDGKDVGSVGLKGGYDISGRIKAGIR